jgi:hypothetical protein
MRRGVSDVSEVHAASILKIVVRRDARPAAEDVWTSGGLGTPVTDGFGAHGGPKMGNFDTNFLIGPTRTPIPTIPLVWKQKLIHTRTLMTLKMDVTYTSEPLGPLDIVTLCED